MYIIPDEVLNQLLCSVCFQYLSAKPVKIYKNKVFNTKCGRCSEDKDDGIVSVYETIIGNGLFPCINRYDGCTQLHTHSVVAIHEEECKSNNYSCPICESDFTSYQFVRHYKKDHPEAVLEKPELLLTNEKEYEKFYMYKENDFIYILYVRCNLGDSFFYVNAACLGPIERVNKIKQYVKCYLGDTRNSDKLFLETKQRYCSILAENNAESFKLPMNSDSITIHFVFNKTDVNVLSYIRNNQISTLINNKSGGSSIVGIDEFPKLYLNKTFEEKFPDTILTNDSYSLKKFENTSSNKSSDYGDDSDDYYDDDDVELLLFPRSCDFCENHFSNSESSLLFTCSQNHIYCHICYNIKPFCYKHDPIIKLELDSSNMEICSLLEFYCKWNCGLTFSSYDLGDHLDNCKKNMYGQVSPRMFIANTFKLFSIYEKSHFISRSNLFSFEKYGFQNGEKIFVITRNNFKFVLHSSYENNMFYFWVSHDYPKEYCNYIEFKIRENFYNKKNPNINKLILDNNKNQIIDNIWGFAVVLNKKDPPINRKMR